MNPIARKNDLVVKEDTGELFIRDLRNENSICLNPSVAYVWQKCDGRRNTNKIAREMQEELGVPVSEKVILLALDRLSAECLLEFSPEFA